MKSIWNIVSIMAVANLVAVLLLIGFVAATGRLNVERVNALRDLFQPTIASEAAKAEQEKAESEADERQVAEAKHEARLRGESESTGEPIMADDMVNIKLEQSEIDRQNLHLLTQHVERLRQTLRSELEQLDRKYKEFEAERKAFSDLRDAEGKTRSDGQFRKSVATLEQMAPKSAKRTIEAMFRAEAGMPVDEAGMTRAVRLLDAMEEGARTAVIDQFQKDDPALAAGLLARIEQHGNDLGVNNSDNMASTGAAPVGGG